MNNFLESAVRITSKHLEREWSLPDTTTKPSTFSPWASTNRSEYFSMVSVIHTATSEMYSLPLNL